MPCQSGQDCKDCDSVTYLPLMFGEKLDLDERRLVQLMPVWGGALLAQKEIVFSGLIRNRV